MKMRIFILMLCAFLQSSVLAQSASFQKLIGKWEVVDADNKTGRLEVLDSSKIFLAYGQEKKPITSFNADFSKSPVWFDFTVDDGSDNITIKSILLFINDNLVQWQVFQGDAVRPAHFTEDKGEIIYLRRKKE
ncbi:MAG: hypothetical protein H0V91_11080 [Flavisolibacter sp.]|jgi:hypothetical protein|nr:hypothetical protein [Flavisolibacter sp.]